MARDRREVEKRRRIDQSIVDDWSMERCVSDAKERDGETARDVGWTSRRLKERRSDE